VVEVEEGDVRIVDVITLTKPLEALGNGGVRDEGHVTPWQFFAVPKGPVDEGNVHLQLSQPTSDVAGDVGRQRAAPRVVVGQEEQLSLASAQEHGVGVAVLVPMGDLDELHACHGVKAKRPEHVHVTALEHLVHGRTGHQRRAVAAHDFGAKLPQTFDVAQMQVGHGHDVGHDGFVTAKRIGPGPQLVREGFGGLDQEVPAVLQLHAKRHRGALSSRVGLGQAAEAATAPGLGQAAVLGGAEHDDGADHHVGPNGS